MLVDAGPAQRRRRHEAARERELLLLLELARGARILPLALESRVLEQPRVRDPKQPRVRISARGDLHHAAQLLLRLGGPGLGRRGQHHQAVVVAVVAPQGDGRLLPQRSRRPAAGLVSGGLPVEHQAEVRAEERRGVAIAAGRLGGEPVDDWVVAVGDHLAAAQAQHLLLLLLLRLLGLGRGLRLLGGNLAAPLLDPTQHVAELEGLLLGLLERSLLLAQQPLRLRVYLLVVDGPLLVVHAAHLVLPYLLGLLPLLERLRLVARVVAALALALVALLVIGVFEEARLARPELVLGLLLVVLCGDLPEHLRLIVLVRGLRSVGRVVIVGSAAAALLELLDRSVVAVAAGVRIAPGSVGELRALGGLRLGRAGHQRIQRCVLVVGLGGSGGARRFEQIVERLVLVARGSCAGLARAGLARGGTLGLGGLSGRLLRRTAVRAVPPLGLLPEPHEALLDRRGDDERRLALRVEHARGHDVPGGGEQVQVDALLLVHDGQLPRGAAADAAHEEALAGEPLDVDLLLGPV